MPIFVSDIDGTLSMYHQDVAEFAGLYFNRPMPIMPYDGSVPFRDYLDLTQQEHRAMKLAYRQGGHKRFATMYDGAADFINDLRMLGSEIWVATTRPFDRLDNIDPDTREWLRRHQIRVDGLLYGEDKYDQLIEAIDPRRVVLCFEDLSEQMLKGSSLGLPMYQIYRDHNKSERWIGGGFGDAWVYARNALVEWQEKYE